MYEYINFSKTFVLLMYRLYKYVDINYYIKIYISLYLTCLEIYLRLIPMYPYFLSFLV